MRGTQQNWNLVCKWGPYDNHTQPRTKPHPQRDLGLILGYLRPPQGHQQPPGRSPVLKPSSNYNVSVGWIEEPATDSWFLDAFQHMIWNFLDAFGQSCFSLKIAINFKWCSAKHSKLRLWNKVTSALINSQWGPWLKDKSTVALHYDSYYVSRGCSGILN